MWGRFLSGIGIFILALYFFLTEVGLHFKKDLLRDIFSFCMPITIYYLLGWVVSYIDRYIINNYMSSADVGVFDFAVKCTLLIDFLQMGLANSITPKIFSIWKNKGASESSVEVNKYYSGFTALSISAILVTIILIPIIVPLIVYKDQYYQAFIYVPVLAIGFGFKGLYNMFLNPIYFQKKTKVLTKIFFISSVIQVITSIFFIKAWGVWGIIWAGLFSKLIQVVLLYFESRKIFSYKFNMTKLIMLPVFFSTIIIMTEIFFSKLMNITILHVSEFILISIITLFVYKNEVALIRKMVFPPTV
jgi:O-antigen/teichoic acid export membrane protein